MSSLSETTIEIGIAVGVAIANKTVEVFGDSRELTQEIMVAAKKFENLHRDTAWEGKVDYYEAVDKFSQEFIASSLCLTKGNKS